MGKCLCSRLWILAVWCLLRYCCEHFIFEDLSPERTGVGEDRIFIHIFDEVDYLCCGDTRFSLDVDRVGHLCNHRFQGFDIEIPTVKLKVALDLEFEFSNAIVRMAFGRVFEQVANRLVDSFVKRADSLYGRPRD